MDNIVIDKSNFKDPKFRHRTHSLFIDTCQKKRDEEFAVYVLRSTEDIEYEGKIYYSLYRLYMLERDVTEYAVAMKYFLSWEHWKILRNNATFSPYFDKWHEELEMMLRSEAIKQAVNSADGGNFNAAKWISDKGWEMRRGRPTKKERAKRLAQDEKLSEQFDNDFERLGIQ